MVILGLGSNVDNRIFYLSQGVHRLKRFVTQMRLSSVYESPALLKPDAPAEWNKPFLNMAVAGECSLSPQEVLQQIKKLEAELGRQKRGVWAPREIDIDILAWDAKRVNEPQLQIPHAELLNRDFALVPLAEVAPDWVYPKLGDGYGKTAKELASAIDSSQLQKTNRSVSMSG